MNLDTTVVAALAALVLALLEPVKAIPVFEGRPWSWPLASIVLAVALAMLWLAAGIAGGPANAAAAALDGLAAGLGACGLYSAGGKKLISTLSPAARRRASKP